MELIQSPLKIFDFHIIESRIQAIEPPGEEPLNRKSVFEAYSIEFDFLFHLRDTDDYVLFTRILINGGEEPAPGYKIFVEMMTVLGFEGDEQLTEAQKKDLVYLSGLNVSIGSLRSFIANTTAYGPFGKYLLPAVDPVALHKAKALEQDAE